ncbi:MAG: DUF86 domain-containing protein [Candidatus Methanoperedens sp.]|nr:DUF86 domain-containing protein [Candidatus Methanoperedens sp.]
MVELNKKILAEKENVEIALGNLKYTMARNEKTVIELAAIGTFLHNIYNGIENILKQVIKAKGVDIPESATWHKKLLNISVSKGIISDKLSDQLYEYLTFRHFFVHAYGFMLDEAHLEILAKDIPDIWLQFMEEIEK